MIRRLTMQLLFVEEVDTRVVALEAKIKRLKPFEGQMATLQATMVARDAQITTLEQSMKSLQDQVDITPPNEQWDFI